MQTVSTTRETRVLPKVLVVEDEPAILAGLVQLLGAQGFSPDPVSDGRAAMDKLLQGGYDLVILDLMLPGLSGLEILSRTRGRGDMTPVLVLTAKGSETDVVAGLERGADDYMTKPFGIHELVARARGLLRRRPVEVDQPRRITVGSATIDLDRLEVLGPGDKVELTPREGSLLEYLIARRHRPVGRDELLVDVWGYQDGSVRTRTVDVHIQQLRSKLKVIPGGEDWIVTVRGRGYRFEAEQLSGL